MTSAAATSPRASGRCPHPHLVPLPRGVYSPSRAAAKLGTGLCRRFALVFFSASQPGFLTSPRCLFCRKCRETGQRPSALPLFPLSLRGLGAWPDGPVRELSQPSGPNHGAGDNGRRQPAVAKESKPSQCPLSIAEP